MTEGCADPIEVRFTGYHFTDSVLTRIARGDFDEDLPNRVVVEAAVLRQMLIRLKELETDPTRDREHRTRLRMLWVLEQALKDAL